MTSRAPRCRCGPGYLKTFYTKDLLMSDRGFMEKQKWQAHGLYCSNCKRMITDPIEIKIIRDRMLEIRDARYNADLMNRF